MTPIQTNMKSPFTASNIDRKIRSFITNTVFSKSKKIKNSEDIGKKSSLQNMLDKQKEMIEA